MKKIILVAALAAVSTLAAAADFPTRTIQMLVGFSPGGASDAAARLVAGKLGARLGVSAIVQNVPGASGTIAAQKVAQAAPDGHTLLVSSATDTSQAVLRKDLTYDFERGFVAVARIAVSPLVLVANPSLPASSIKELVAAAKSSPGSIQYGSAGIGSSLHLAGELLSIRTGAEFTHVPFKGTSEAIQAAVGGHIPMMFCVPSSAIPFLEGGRLKALAVTSRQRFPTLPDVPTIDESGLPGYELLWWVGIQAPAGTPSDVVAQLARQVDAIVNSPDVKAEFTRLGLIPEVDGTPEKFSAFIREDLVHSEQLIKRAGASTK